MLTSIHVHIEHSALLSFSTNFYLLDFSTEQIPDISLNDRPAASAAFLPKKTVQEPQVYKNQHNPCQEKHVLILI